MLSEQDEELLEAYLDDALSPEEVDRVAGRLSAEPRFNAALAELRQQRRQRAAVWESLEPSEERAGAFAASVIRAAHRRQWMSRVSWMSRLSGAAAACILVGLGSGWYVWGRGSVATGMPSPSGGAPSVISPPGTSIASNAQNTQNGQIQFVDQTNGLPAGPYQVEILDGSGNVLSVQKFNKPDEAQHFAQDLGQVLERQQNVQDGHVTLVSDHPDHF
jgi:hypothetical protein